MMKKRIRNVRGYFKRKGSSDTTHSMQTEKSSANTTNMAKKMMKPKDVEEMESELLRESKRKKNYPAIKEMQKLTFPSRKEFISSLESNPMQKIKEKFHFFV